MLTNGIFQANHSDDQQSGITISLRFAKITLQVSLVNSPAMMEMVTRFSYKVCSLYFTFYPAWSAVCILPLFYSLRVTLTATSRMNVNFDIHLDL